MSFKKSVPDKLKPRECKHTKLREPPPIPYIPKKDKVQEEVARLRNLQIKTSLEKDITLNFPVWHKNGTQEAFLMHVMAVLDAIKKCGHFKDYDKAQKAHDEAKKAVELAEVGLALLNGTSAGTRKNCKKKALAKAKEAAKEVLAKVPDPESEAKEAEEATKVTKDTMKAGFQVDLEKAKQAQEIAKGAMTAAASEMFAFYLNLLSPESKCAWNKIIGKQTKAAHLSTYKVSLWKTQGECLGLASRLMPASCFTCLPHFPSTWQSKKSTMSPMYLRSPSASEQNNLGS
jgi:hypothetical protein